MWFTNKKQIEEIQLEQHAILEKIESLEQQVISLSKYKNEMDTMLADKTRVLESRNKELQSIIEMKSALSHSKINEVKELVQENKQILEGIITSENDKIIKAINDEQDSVNGQLVAINSSTTRTLENLAYVDTSLKQVVDYLLSLDEGNRLVIAKLLLEESRG